MLEARREAGMEREVGREGVGIVGSCKGGGEVGRGVVNGFVGI